MILVLMPMFAWNFIYAQPFTIDAAASGFRTREERVGFAKSLIKYFDRVDSQIPNLHPREEDWVIKEGSRILSIPDLIEQAREGRKLMSSKDWKVFAAKREAAELRGQVQSIVDRGYGQTGFGLRGKLSDADGIFSTVSPAWSSDRFEREKDYGIQTTGCP